MRPDKRTNTSIRNGHAHADEIFALRNKALRRRAKALAGRPAAAAAAERGAPQLLGLPQALTAASRGLLIAEGDSWFDYFRVACDQGGRTDILRGLKGLGFDVASIARKGDRIQDMAYSDGQLEAFSELVEEQLRNQKPIRAILISGGGNDVVERGKFGLLLNHASSTQPGLNEERVKSLIDQTLHEAYTHVLGAITRLCQLWLQRPVPILLHGYAYPVPDGRGHCTGFSGPWMGPEFHNLGYDDLTARKVMAKALIDRFNEMLARLPTLQGFGHVTYVNLRDALSTAPSDYKHFWENELHPTEKGFGRLTDRFASVLDGLGS